MCFALEISLHHSGERSRAIMALLFNGYNKRVFNCLILLQSVRYIGLYDFISRWVLFVLQSFAVLLHCVICMVHCMVTCMITCAVKFYFYNDYI